MAHTSQSDRVIQQRKTLSFGQWLGILVVIGLLLRLPVVFAVVRQPDVAILASDSREYLALANNLIDYGVYSTEKNPPPLPLEHNRTPIYAAFLMPFVFIWGAAPLVPIVASQALLGLLIAPLTALFAAHFWGQRFGVIAGLIAVLSPMSAIMSGYVYTEVFFTLLLLGGLFLAVKSIANERWLTGVLSGLLLGSAALTRPILLPTLSIIAIGLLFYVLKQKNGLPYAAAIICVSFLPLLPWMARNATLFGRFSLTTISDTNLYYYNAASLEAHLTDQSLDETRQRLAIELESIDAEGSRWPAARERELARGIILDTPLAFAWYNGVDAINGFRPGFSFLLSLNGQDDSVAVAVRTFTDGTFADAIQVVREQPIGVMLLQLYMVIYLLVLLLMLLGGIVILFIERQWHILLLCLGISGALLYLPGIASNARFRMPVEPLMATIGAYGIVFIAQKLMAKDSLRDATETSS